MEKSRKKSKIKQRSKIFDCQQYEHLNWIFPPQPPHLPGEHGLPKDHYDHTQDTDYESICGGNDDSQDVELYDGTLGVTQVFVQNNERPVGQLQWNNNLGTIYSNPGNVNDVRWCSGTLISRDLFLTAGHCFDQNPNGWVVPRSNGTGVAIEPNEIATNMHVNFNYQFAPDGTLRAEEQFPILELVEYRLGRLDFAIIRLGGNPGDRFGFTRISRVDGNEAETICIIQHPSGVPKRIDAGTIFHLHDNRLGYDNIDTLGGSSGSGILQESTGRIIGVHTNGGCDSPATGHNHGVRISSIINNSPTIRGILNPKFKFADDPPIATLKFVDDPPRPTFKFTDDPNTFKFTDDPNSFKFTDDPKLKFADDPTGSFKAIDDVKQPGLDKNPASDSFGNFGRPNFSQQNVAAPFILSTPHHSNAWSTSFPDAHQAKVSEYEAILAKYEEEIHRMGNGDLNNTSLATQYQQLVQQYQQVKAEYQQLIGR